MTENATQGLPSHLVQKRVQLLLRGGKTLEGLIHIPDGMPLLDFLRMKRFFLNLTEVRIEGDSGPTYPLPHLSIRLSNVIWVMPLEGSLHVSSGIGVVPAKRSVELHLVDDLSLSVALHLAEEQRMSDYLDANPGFLPLWTAKIGRSDQVIDRLAVNHDAILAIRELSDTDR